MDNLTQVDRKVEEHLRELREEREVRQERLREMNAREREWQHSKARLWVSNPERKMFPATQADIVDFIVEKVASADDPFTEGGQWLTRLTMAITEAMNNVEP